MHCLDLARHPTWPSALRHITDSQPYSATALDDQEDPNDNQGDPDDNQEGPGDSNDDSDSD